MTTRPPYPTVHDRFGRLLPSTKRETQRKGWCFPAGAKRTRSSGSGTSNVFYIVFLSSLLEKISLFVVHVSFVSWYIHSGHSVTEWFPPWYFELPLPQTSLLIIVLQFILKMNYFEGKPIFKPRYHAARWILLLYCCHIPFIPRCLTFLVKSPFPSNPRLFFNLSLIPTHTPRLMLQSLMNSHESWWNPCNIYHIG